MPLCSDCQDLKEFMSYYFKQVVTETIHQLLMPLIHFQCHSITFIKTFETSIGIGINQFGHCKHCLMANNMLIQKKNRRQSLCKHRLLTINSLAKHMKCPYEGRLAAGPKHTSKYTYFANWINKQQQLRLDINILKQEFETSLACITKTHWSQTECMTIEQHPVGLKGQHWIKEEHIHHRITV